MKSNLNEKEVAEILGISLSKLRADRQHRRGIPFVKIGKRVLYQLEDIQETLEKNKILTRNDITET
jgi:hypothetical protein